MNGKRRIVIAGLCIGAVVACGSEPPAEVNVDRDRQSLEKGEKGSELDVRRVRVGKYASAFDADQGWSALTARMPDAAAWAAGDRLDKLRSRKGIFAPGHDERHPCSVGRADPRRDLARSPRCTGEFV